MTLKLCHLDDLPAGLAQGFDPSDEGQDTVIALRHGDDVRVYRNDCPHAHRPLGWRKNQFLSANAQYIQCFAHGAQFEIGSGHCIAGPCIGQSLTSIPHRIDDCVVHIRLD